MTEYAFLKTTDTVKDPFAGGGQGNESRVFNTTDDKGDQVRRITRDGDVVTIECTKGPHLGLSIDFPWGLVKWARRMVANSNAKKVAGAGAKPVVIKGDEP